ncbi:Serine/threonine-protein phosphatase 7 long form homolog [Linum perenne]
MWLPLLGDFSYAGSLSWGSACLAWLYREMCRASHVLAEQISRTLFILQIWAWEHFPFIARTPSDPNVQLPHPWEYPFPNADPSHTFTHPPRSNVGHTFYGSGTMHGFQGGPSTHQAYVGSSSGSGYQTHPCGGPSTEFQHPPTGFQQYANVGSGFGASLYNRPPAYSSIGGSHMLGENMYTPIPLYTTPSTGITQSGVPTEHADDTEDDEEEAPSMIHKRLRKKKQPKKRGCCPTD